MDTPHRQARLVKAGRETDCVDAASQDRIALPTDIDRELDSLRRLVVQLLIRIERLQGHSEPAADSTIK
jgi:hypothetical protein